MATKEISTWLATADLPTYPKLSTDIDTDVAIIGGGLAGLMSAYLLAKAGKKVAVLEKDWFFRLGSGFTTGFLSQSIDTDFTDQVSMFGDADTKRIWESHGAGIDLIERIVKEERIDCEFMRCTNYQYANDRKERRVLDEELAEMKRLKLPATLHRDGLPIKNSGVIAVKNQGKFHAVKFAAGLLAALERMEVSLYEKTEVTKIDGDGSKQGRRFTVETKGKKHVTAEWALTATYQPFDNPKEVFLQKGMYVSYIIELEVPKGTFPEGTYEDFDNPYHYFRVDAGKGAKGKDRLLIGGEDHRKELFTKRMQEKSFTALEDYAEEALGTRYPIVRRWSGYILEPVDGLAFIGEYDPKRLLATAFSGNGMTYSALTARMVRDIVTGKKNAYASLYRPGRTPTFTQLWKKGRDFTEEFFRGAAVNLFKRS